MKRRGNNAASRPLPPGQVRHRETVRRTGSPIDRSRWLSFAVCASATLVVALWSPHRASALDAVEVTPNHATQTAYGGRWECDRGYRSNNDGSCQPVALPANAYATDSSFGAGWECRRGYRESEGSCISIGVPENGYLSAGRGDTWKCARGFRANRDACIAIKVPANAFLSTSSYGSGWECERGYRAVDDSCFAFVVPANAHINGPGNGWACNRPYRKTREACELR